MAACLGSIVGGDSWSAINTGLTNLVVNALATDPTGAFYAGTDGSGVFKEQQRRDELERGSTPA